MLNLCWLKRKTDLGNFILQQYVDGKWVDVKCEEEDVNSKLRVKAFIRQLNYAKRCSQTMEEYDAEAERMLIQFMNAEKSFLICGTPRPKKEPKKKLLDIIKSHFFNPSFTNFTDCENEIRNHFLDQIETVIDDFCICEQERKCEAHHIRDRIKERFNSA